MVLKIAIIGARGFAREVLDVFEACNRQSAVYEVLGYVVEREFGRPGSVINDKPILGDFDWLQKHAADVSVICGLGNPQVRRQLILRATEAGCNFCNAIHPTAVLTPRITMGIGNVITAGCILTNQIRIGNQVHLNLDCTIGHDVVMEDYVTLAPGVHVSGNVTLEEGCVVGTGANIIEGVKIGAWSIVGAGSTIVHNVPSNTTVIGVPGKVIKTRQAGWHLTPQQPIGN